MIDISIIIPALNEAAKIGRDVETAAAYISAKGMAGEVIVVDDGSTDGTAEAARQAAAAGVEVKVIRLETNSGKGAALKAGVLSSRGEVVICTDSGTCVPYDNADEVVGRIRNGALDIGLASRRHPLTIIKRNRPIKRRVISRLFRWAAVWVGGLPRWITDSQCGFKVYRGSSARDLFGASRTSGYLFELEVLRAALAKGLRVEEFPVEWTCDLDSRLHPGSDAPGVVRELLKIRKNSADRANKA